MRPGRDRFVDVVRAFAILAIVGQHWLLPVSSDGGTRPTTGNSLTVLEGWASTLLSPVLPLIFFAGGAAAAGSLHTHRRLAGPTDRPRSWLADCTVRLALPVLPLVAILLPLHHLLVATGAPAQAVHSAAALVGRLAWFLAAYALLVSLTPILVRLHERCRGLELIVIATGAVAAEVVRLVGADGTNWLGHLLEEADCVVVAAVGDVTRC